MPLAGAGPVSMNQSELQLETGELDVRAVQDIGIDRTYRRNK